MTKQRIQFYRDQAKLVRQRAARMTPPDIKKDMEAIARQYDQMADHIEEIEKKSRGDD